MMLGITGAREAKAAIVLLDIGGQVAGVEEVLVQGQLWVDVPPQAHDVPDAGGHQVLEVVVQIGLAAAHAGDVGQGLDLHLVLHKGGHLGGGDASGTAAAGTTGDADKGRIHLLGLPQQVLELFPARFRLRREDFQGEDTLFLGEKLTNQHGKLPTEHAPFLSFFIYSDNTA